MEQAMIELLQLVKEGAEAGVAQFPALAEQYIGYRLWWFPIWIGMVVVYLAGTIPFVRPALERAQDDRRDGPALGCSVGLILWACLTLFFVLSLVDAINGIIHANMSPATFIYKEIVLDTRCSQ